MITRRDAMDAKDGMERYKSPEMQLRVRSVTNSIPWRFTPVLLLTYADSVGRRLWTSRLQ